MTPIESETDLMERMQRVAGRPRKSAIRGAKRQTQPARRRRDLNHVRAAASEASVTMAEAAQTRLATLIEWGRWELTSVPQQRWNMLKTLVKGR